MNVSLNWLREYVDLAGKSVQELDDLLTFAGIEIEAIHQKGVASDRIVVAQVVEAVQHPNADRLKVCQVDAGEGSLRQIVCGAQNYKVGDKVPCALPGAVLPGGFAIGEAKMRGVESKGMLCSASEIGLVDKENGLLILEGDPVIGTPLQQIFASDVLLEVEVTPNRPDLLSHRGLAYELEALLRQDHRNWDLPALPLRDGGDMIANDAPSDCPHYTLTKISGVVVADSPEWLKQRLISIGLRPINNIVDITNFVLHETGQPLHAFDAAEVGGKIHLRGAVAGESFAALNGGSYELRDGDLLISDASGQALALAGIMGGSASGVTGKTVDVLLESAYFDPQKTRATSRAYLLSSDSSYRFERGVNPQGVVELDVARLDQLMGGSISLEDAADILQRLGLVAEGDNRWRIPAARADLQRHIDLVEEIARVHGLDRVPGRLRATFVPASEVDAAADIDMALRRTLAALGLYESQTIKLISEKQMIDALPLRPLQEGDVIRVSHPLSEDHAILRPSLIPGLVATAERNVRQGLKALRFFELGRVFRHSGGGKSRDNESDTLAILLSGPLAHESWAAMPGRCEIHDLKAVIARMLPGKNVRFSPRERPGFVLGCDVLCDGVNLGVAARLLPSRERALDFTAPVWLAELDLAKLRKLIGQRIAVEELPQFPGSSRDAAMEMPADLMAAKVDEVIAAVRQPLLEQFHCFDVFCDPTGQKLDTSRKSMAYRFHYRAVDRTLKAEEVDAAHAMILEKLLKELPVHFR